VAVAMAMAMAMVMAMEVAVAMAMAIAAHIVAGESNAQKPLSRRQSTTPFHLE
jgi:hypothetical protein